MNQRQTGAAVSGTANSATVESFFDETTFAVSYIVTDTHTGHCAIIDPVADFDVASGKLSWESADRLVHHVKGLGLTNDWILETHVHADHLTAAQHLQDRIGGKIGIGRRVIDVQRTFGKLFNAGPSFATDGSQFDKLFDHGESFEIGSLHARVMHTPGHTPDSVTYVVGDRAFVGDTLFMPDYGTARTDFPGGDAAMLYQSIQKILALPDDTRLYLCHDYKAPGRDEFHWETTVAAEREYNIHLTRHDDLLSFVHFRQDRDTELSAPRLMLPSVQVNMRAGKLPPAEPNGMHYLKIPVRT